MACYLLLSATQVEMKKIIIDRMLYVMSCGSVLAVARYFEAASRSIDGTLLRYYVAEVCVCVSC